MKQYEADYYYVTMSGEDKNIRGEKYLGSVKFFHNPTKDFPLERKAFMVAPSNFVVANKLKIHQVSR